MRASIIFGSGIVLIMFVPGGLVLGLILVAVAYSMWIE